MHHEHQPTQPSPEQPSFDDILRVTKPFPGDRVKPGMAVERGGNGSGVIETDWIGIGTTGEHDESTTLTKDVLDDKGNVVDTLVKVSQILSSKRYEANCGVSVRWVAELSGWRLAK